ncbi:hypothetical protein VNO78_08334 [Psophocarpus tetragonolobus]|uniref:Uncharacterized protein n=1 Tax=Psophocarpus tetragonolobus TaxID=3891 RepID=A0AAN9XTA5_PSOTE
MVTKVATKHQLHRERSKASPLFLSAEQPLSLFLSYLVFMGLDGWVEGATGRSTSIIKAKNQEDDNGLVKDYSKS